MNESNERTSQLVREHQKTLLHTTKRLFAGSPIPSQTSQAFLDTPRHVFTPRFYSSQRGRWVNLDEENLEEHLPELYADHPLGIYRNATGKTLSTISQPSLVLYMLDLLDLKPGMNVFELGGGSGWNAAMIGRIVGRNGHVTSVEIIEKLAHTATEIVKRLDLPQVQIIAGDGSLGVSETAPYQRGVYTASAWDLPASFYEQIEDDGLLLLVIKISAQSDLLTLLRKTTLDRFESEQHFVCSFVPVTGSQPTPEQAPIRMAELNEFGAPQEYSWNDIRIEGHQIPSFIEFASLVKDCQQPYLVESEDYDFDEEFAGFRSEDRRSLVLFNDDRVLLYGSEGALIDLRRAAKRWLKAERPSIEDLKLQILRTSSEPETSNDQWLAPRGDSMLLWSLQ